MKNLKLCFLVVFILAGAFAFANAIDFGDAIKDVGPGKKGISSSIEVLRLTNKVFTQVRTDDASKDFLEYLDAALEQFDFHDLYFHKSLTDQSNGYRGVTVQGRNEPDSYYIGLVTPAERFIIPNTLGSFTSDISLKKVDQSIVGYPSYAGKSDTKAISLQFSQRNLLSFWQGLLKVIDPDNIQNLKARERNVFKNLSGDSGNVLNVFYEAFPEFSILMDKYIELGELLEIKSQNDVKYTHLTMKVRGKYNGLAKDYPLIATYIDQFTGVTKSDVKFVNANNNTIAAMSFDTSKDFFTLNLYTKDGKLIPYDKNDNPIFDDAFALTELKNYQFKIITGFYFDAYGLKYQNDRIIVNADYVDTSAMGVLYCKLAEVDKTKVYGRKFHVIPKWMINFFIPSDIDQLIHDLVAVMLDANKGEGSFMKFEFDRRRPINIFRHTGSTEYVDNFFIKLELKIWWEVLKTNQKTLDSINELIVTGINSIQKDLQKMILITQTEKNAF